MAKTNAEKQADRRARLSADGLFKRRDFYVHPDDEPELRELEQNLRNKRLEENKMTMTTYAAQFQKNECCTNDKKLKESVFYDKTEALSFLEAQLDSEDSLSYYDDKSIADMKADGMDIDFYEGEGYYNDGNLIASLPLFLEENYPFGDWATYKVTAK